jgi:Ca2+/H+ antiporter, TMEM165/GDT1 family
MARRLAGRPPPRSGFPGCAGIVAAEKGSSPPTAGRHAGALVVPGQRVRATAWMGETFDRSSRTCCWSEAARFRPAAPSGSEFFVVLSVIAATFILVLPVELPDKTLFATLVLATRFAPLPVFVGVGTAFGLQVAIAVTAGSLLSLLPEALVTGVVAVLFLVGAVVLWRSASSGPEDEDLDETPAHPSFLKAAAISFGVLFAAEWGDLSQLATAGMAARTGEPLSVFVGAWAALLVVSGLAVFLGKKLADRLPIALIRRVAAVLFLAFAVFAVVETVRALT